MDPQTGARTPAPRTPRPSPPPHTHTNAYTGLPRLDGAGITSFQEAKQRMESPSSGVVLTREQRRTTRETSAGGRGGCATASPSRGMALVVRRRNGRISALTCCLLCAVGCPVALCVAWCLVPGAWCCSSRGTSLVAVASKAYVPIRASKPRHWVCADPRSAWRGIGGCCLNWRADVARGVTRSPSGVSTVQQMAMTWVAQDEARAFLGGQ